MPTQPINDDITHYLLRHMSTSCKSEIIVLENNQIAYSTDFRQLGFGEGDVTLSSLMQASTPETRQIIMSTREVWNKLKMRFPGINLSRCYLSINLQFVFESGPKFLLFTFSHMDESRQLVFVREGEPDVDSRPRILDPHAKRGYVFNGEDWQLEDWNLSATEYSILHLSAQGRSAKEISDALNLAYDTINFHKKKILKKMGTANIIGALAIFAQRTGIPLEGTPIVMNCARLK